MSRRIFNFELNGNTVLGFDTGLNAQAFAQAKMAQFITRPGFIVYPEPAAGSEERGSSPGGRVKTWQQGGVTEFELQGAKTMIIWGPSFPGERLDEIVNENSRQDEALDALRFWIRAREVLQNFPGETEQCFPGPAGAFIVTAHTSTQTDFYPTGTIFFPPVRLIKRTLVADGKEAVLDSERWVHPDLEEAEAVSFSAGVMLYRIFCGASPFTRDNDAELRQDIREGVFVPPNLAAPGLDPQMSDLIIRAMSRVNKNSDEKPRPAPNFILGFLGPPSSRPVSFWVNPLREEEAQRISAEREQYAKKKARAVKTRRFMIRNTAIITGSLIALIVLLFAIRGIVRHNAELPTTRGMEPIEVVFAYYSAFDALDNAMMEACVSGKAGKGDIEMAANLYVIGKMRQAYEAAGEQLISAKKWLEAGRPATDKDVFGITDIKIKSLSLGETAASFRAEYILWIPATGQGEDPPSSGEASNQTLDENSPVLPRGLVTMDRLNLVFHRGSWRITEISRERSPLESSEQKSTVFLRAKGR